jgi:hypothetical protein
MIYIMKVVFLINWEEQFQDVCRKGNSSSVVSTGELNSSEGDLNCKNVEPGFISFNHDCYIVSPG